MIKRMITNKTFELLNELASIPEGKGSRTTKQKLLEDNIEHLKEYIDIAFNPYRIFKVVQIPSEFTYIHKDTPNSLEELAKYLEKQKGGTLMSKDLVAWYVNSQPESHRKWIKDSILKNVKLGVDIKTLNKAGYDLPTFELLLASPNKDNSLDGVQFPCFVQEKLDGVRCIYLPEEKVFLGRNGKLIPNVKLADFFNIDFSTVGQEYILDGELYDSTTNFNDIIGITSSDDKDISESFRFVVFNALTKEEWANQKCETDYAKQLKIIEDICDVSFNLERIKTKLAKSAEHVMEIHAEFIGRGLEGTMVRGLRSMYQWKRVKLNEDVLIKIKQSDMTDGEIIGTYEGENRHQNALGGFIVRLDDGIEVRVGGGFSDELRKELWPKRDSLIGQWVLIKYTEKTPDGKSLRFPIFNGIRDAK